MTWSRRSIWRRLAPFIALAFLAGTLSVIYIRNPKRGLPYRDQFRQGHFDEWQQFGGTWSLTDGSVRNNSDERGAKLLIGSPYWKNYSVEADVEVLGRGDAGLVIRASDPDEGVDAYNGYYAGVRLDDQVLVLGRASYGWLEYSPVHFPGGIFTNHWYHIVLAGFNCVIQASATDLSTSKNVHTSIFDPNCAQSGKAGLRSVESGGAWKNVQIQAIHNLVIPASPIEAPSNASLYPTSQGSSPRIYRPIRDHEALQNSRTLSASVQSIGSLRLFAVAGPVDVTVRGTVVLTEPKVYIQDATGGAEVSFVNAASPKVGDEIEVTGDALLDGLSLSITNATERSISGVVPIPALSITPLQAAIGRYDGMFVELEGRLSAKGASSRELMKYRLEGGQQEFYAMPGTRETAERLGKVGVGSTVRMRGICMVRSSFTQDRLPFALIVRSPDDVEILSGPPWWSVGHITIMGLGMLGIGFLIHLLYSHAHERRHAAVLEERERLAHEMHDTLAQSFAGLDFQMRAIRRHVQKEFRRLDTEKLCKEIDRASDLVRRSHDEARRSLASLRPEILEKLGLSDALTQVSRRMIAGNEIRIGVHITGQPRPLPVRVTDAFFRIGQEAVANAVQHSHANNLVIRFDYQHASLLMTVEDDGRGFCDSADSEGFGLTGMRRRAKLAHAELLIKSDSSGTKISVSAPCKTESLWSSSLSYIKNLGYNLLPRR